MAAGSDIHVRPNGTLNISYSLVTGLSSNYVGVVDGGNGGRVNLGFSGNTREAALTKRAGAVYYIR